MANIKIGLASDHAGFELKERIKRFLEKQGYSCVDYGTYSKESVSYAFFGHQLANAVEKKDVSLGIAVCGSGNGINMALNKHQGIRSALCWNEDIAYYARAHNDANVLALPGRFISTETAKKMVTKFLNTPFEGGRHKQRIDAIPLNC
ncbi:MAG: ribose 5-phosphate isomerase B [Dysgonamonadaceae bacterium]|jgi:ribose 5-phosphate isomerase B|nr:ribose 5-phosphate isomerase B [Dysgonamonadaceae bacterium]